MKRVVVLLGFFLAVAVAVVAHLSFDGGPMRTAGAQDQGSARSSRSHESAIPVLLAQARRMTLPVSFSTIGTIQSTASIPVTSQVSGIVSAVAVTDGAQVKQGDRLIELDPRLVDAQIAQSEALILKDQANVAKAQRDLDRTKKLLSSRIETPENAADAQTTLDLAEAVLQSDQAGLRSYQVQREYYTIRAPVSGRIGTVPVKPGSTVVAAALANPIVTINAFDPIYVAVGIPERMIADLAGDKARGIAKVKLTVPGRKDLLEGAVTVIDNAANPSTGLVTALAQVSNSPAVLWPGEIVNVDVVFHDDTDSLTVPNAAIQTSQQGNYVYTVDASQHAYMKPVVVTRSVEGMTVITSGLNEGDHVVTDGQLLLSNGALVSTKQAMQGG
jgi:multidrug efflux system membrane fusion protein